MHRHESHSLIHHVGSQFLLMSRRGRAPRTLLFQRRTGLSAQRTSSHPTAASSSGKVFPVPIPRPAPGHARAWVLGAIGILLGCAFAIWFGLASTLGKPSWTNLGYHVIDDRTVDVTYLVSRPIGRDVTCVIRAMDQGVRHGGPSGGRHSELPKPVRETHHPGPHHHPCGHRSGQVLFGRLSTAIPVWTDNWYS